MSPIWSVAVLVYVLMGFGVAIFVIPRATSTASAAGFGALFGLATFGLYDLTNYSTLTQWPLAVTVVDITWGMITCAIGSAAVWSIVGR